MSHPEQAALPSNSDACHVVELLRVTLLSLEGIELAEETLCPNHRSSSIGAATVSNHWRITAWAGFRSSFPAGCLSVPTSHYSTVFQREGDNLLAVESDQIELDGSTDGRVHWQDSLQYDERQPSDDGGGEQLTATMPQHHLQVILPPPQPTHSETTPACDDLMLPDIIEIHVCIACILKNPQFEDCATDEEGQDTSCRTKEEHFTHGIAHLKIPSREQYNVNNLDLSGFSRPGGKVVMLPIQTKLPTNDADETLATFVQNAFLSMRVEKSTVPTEQFRNWKEVQRHYIESDWNGESCAPASINSFESQGKGTHILRAGQIINGLRQTFSSQVSNLKKSHEEQPISNDDSEQSKSKSITLVNKSFSELFKFGCGELGDVLQGDEMGMFDQSNTVDSSLATADVIGG
eukprot:scaffold7689_cov139-Skeletonema_menzelii.AAC.11